MVYNKASITPHFQFMRIHHFATARNSTPENSAAQRGHQMNKIGKITTALLIPFALSVLLTGCVFGKRELFCHDDIQETCESMLKNCFGEEYVLSDGVEKEESFWDEYENTSIVTHYTEWTLTYSAADGQDHTFIFNNRNGRGSDREHLA